MENLVTGTWLWFVLLSGSFLIANACFYFVGMWYFNRQKRALVAVIKRYFESPDGQTPSEFAGLIDTVSKHLVGVLMASVKGASMGAASGEARQEKALEAAFTQDMMEQSGNPLMKLLTNLPAVSKLIKKNPGMAEAAAGFLASKMQKWPAGGPAPSALTPQSGGNHDISKIG